MVVLSILYKTFTMAFSMFWEVLWPLILGFTLSAVVQAVISHKTMAKTLGEDSIKSTTLASFFGIASSSCSYAAVALARSIFQKGASFTNAMIFEIASTNLVIELGIILLVTIGWQFAAAEWIGGVIMIILLALIFRFTITKRLVAIAYQQTNKGIQGRMEGHASMDMSIQEKGSFWSRVLSPKGFTAISHFFVVDWMSIWIDLLLGFFVAGFLSVVIPKSFWQTLFFVHNHAMSFIIGPLIGPLIAIISFVCSIGNIPLAAVLWSGGISFGGIISFIFADLLVLPILDIYRKYYGWKATAYIFVTFYLTMTAAGYLTELIFKALSITPTNRSILLLTSQLSWNYTTFLNIGLLILVGILLWRFYRTDGVQMLRMMNNQSTKHIGHHHG